MENISQNYIKPTSSPLFEVKESNIHNLGVFATKKIKNGTKIIEYVGEKISKEESDNRFQKTFLEYTKDGNKTKGGVYLFTLDDKYDLDGNVLYNTARLINHSCQPNCEAINEDGRVWIYAIKRIKKGQELAYNYGYSIKTWKDHPCKCGSRKCVGYIVDEEYWNKLKILKLKQYLKKLSKKIFNE